MTRRRRGGRGRAPRRNAEEEWSGKDADEDWPNLVDMVLSWSLEDVMDEDVFKNKNVRSYCIAFITDGGDEDDDSPPAMYVIKASGQIEAADEISQDGKRRPTFCCSFTEYRNLHPHMALP
ncbi:hypothetical protein ACQ4PT_016852 [Festuca glaucescens]